MRVRVTGSPAQLVPHGGPLHGFVSAWLRLINVLRCAEVLKANYPKCEEIAQLEAKKAEVQAAVKAELEAKAKACATFATLFISILNCGIASVFSALLALESDDSIVEFRSGGASQSRREESS